MSTTVVITAADDSLAEQGLRGAGQDWTSNPNFGVFDSSNITIGTPVLIGEGFTGSGFTLFIAIKGATQAPAQNAFTTVSYTGNNGLRTLNSSAAVSFTQNASATPQESNDTFPAHTSLWEFTLSGSHDFTDASEYTFTFSGGAGPAITGGYGDVVNPEAWADADGNIPPQQFSNVPTNINFPQNGDGRFWWQGNATNAPAGAITFIGDPNYLIGEFQLAWSIEQAATDGSAPSLQYSINGGGSWTSATLGPYSQNGGLIAGQVSFALGTGDTLMIQVLNVGGTAAPTAANWELAIAFTRNDDTKQVWDSSNGLDSNGLNPLNYNTQVPFLPAYDTLSTLQNRMLIRLGFTNQLAAPPPGMLAMTQEFLQSAQNFLYRRFTALHTRRWFRWKIMPLQRFYSLLDNDENQILGYSLDTDKTIEQVMVQDTRNVWYPLIEGIPGQLFTMLAKPWRPARYDIRDAIEIYPAPDQTYFLWVKGHFGLLSFQNPSDITTIDSELVFLHALANAKSHYGQPDANNIEAQANAMRANLVGATHKTAKYVPGTIAVPPAVRPTLVQFQGGESGTS